MQEAMLELHIREASLLTEARNGEEPSRQIHLHARRWDDNTSFTGGPGELYENFSFAIYPGEPEDGCYGKVWSSACAGELAYKAELHLPNEWFQDLSQIALTFDPERCTFILNLILQGIEARSFDMGLFDEPDRPAAVSGVQTVREAGRHHYNEPCTSYQRERLEAVAETLAAWQKRAERPNLSLV